MTRGGAAFGTGLTWGEIAVALLLGATAFLWFYTELVGFMNARTGGAGFGSGMMGDVLLFALVGAVIALSVVTGAALFDDAL